MTRLTVIAALLIVAAAPAILMAANSVDSPYFQEFSDEPTAIESQTSGPVADKGVTPPDLEAKGPGLSSANQDRASARSQTIEPKPDAQQAAVGTPSSSISAYLSLLIPSLHDFKRLLRADARDSGPQAKWDFKPRW